MGMVFILILATLALIDVIEVTDRFSEHLTFKDIWFLAAVEM